MLTFKERGAAVQTPRAHQGVGTHGWIAHAQASIRSRPLGSSGRSLSEGCLGGDRRSLGFDRRHSPKCPPDDF